LHVTAITAKDTGANDSIKWPQRDYDIRPMKETMVGPIASAERTKAQRALIGYIGTRAA